MLKAIQLENFKCYENSGLIPLAPITLIFGPNSVGKSTILQALYLLMQTRRFGDPSIPLLFQAENGFVDLGSYEEVVFEHDHENRNIAIRLDVPFERPPVEHESIGGWYSHVGASTMGLRMEFNRDKQSGEVSLCCCDMLLDEDEEPLTHFRLIKNGILNPKGMWFCQCGFSNRKYWEYLFTRRQDIQKAIDKLEKNPNDQAEEMDPLKKRDLQILSSLRDSRNIEEYIQGLKQLDQDSIWRGSDYYLPGKEYTYTAPLDDPGDEDHGKDVTWLVAHDMTVNPDRAAHSITHGCTSAIDMAVEQCRALGSVHPKPKRVYTFSGSTPKDVGANGERMPELLFRNPELLAKVNDILWVLDMGYTITAEKVQARYSSMFEIRAKKSLSRSHEGGENETTVSLCDLGFGVGQLLPLVVQAAIEKGKTILVEQPETHIHPGLQARLGTFFANNVKENNNQFIIETHSEHLILRLQRLVRKGELSPDLVKVLYVDPQMGENGPVVKELKMDIDGEFVDDWPKGFFPERLREFLD